MAQAEYEMSERHACQLVGVPRSSHRYASSRPDDDELRAKIKDIASKKRRYGYRRIWDELDRAGEEVARSAR